LQRGTEAILLVEDEIELRRTTRRVLENNGYRVFEAQSAHEAIQVWSGQGGHIDLLLTDLLMPGGMTGRELADQLRSDAPKLQVIFTSGYGADVIGPDMDYFRQSQSRFLQKPCSANLLLKTVRESLDAG
jgi:CheY-like chemotaxis protein